MELGDKQSFWMRDTSPLAYVGIATVVVHVLTGNRYGFNRDELAVLEDARHLAWGYVAYPPVTPFFGRIALELFGTSLVGFRFLRAVRIGGDKLCTDRGRLAGFLISHRAGGVREFFGAQAEFAADHRLDHGDGLQHGGFIWLGEE